jgi:hypothetical protein
MTAALGWAEIAAVAERFHALIREAVPQHVSEIDDLNCKQKDVCGTHVFCDPNDYFAEAFLQVVGRDIDVRDVFDLGAYQMAWGIARRRGFSREWERWA